jgi:hypothetical protein
LPVTHSAAGPILRHPRGTTDGVRYVECASSRYGACVRHQQCGEPRADQTGKIHKACAFQSVRCLKAVKLPNRDKKNAYDDAATNPESTVDKREVLTSAKRTPARPAQRTLMPPLACYAPGLAALLHYKLADAPADLRAGLAVTAVELPVGYPSSPASARRWDSIRASYHSWPTQFLGRHGN